MASENASDCVSTNGELLVDGKEDSLKSLQSQNNCVPTEVIIPVVETSLNSNLEVPVEIVDLNSQTDVETVKTDDDKSTGTEIIIPEQKQTEASNLEDCVEITNSQNGVIKEGSDVTESSTSELITPLENSHQETIDLNSQNTAKIVAIEVANTTEPKLSDLENEVQRLRVENEQLNSKLAASNSDADEVNEAAISIRFRDRTYYDLHREKLTRLFDTFIDYSVIADDTRLQINVIKDDHINADEWIVVENDEVDEVSVSKKRKKKSKEKENKKKAKKEHKPEKLEYVLDTTPSMNAESNLKYESKFSVIVDEKLEEKLDSKANFNSCFNCGEEHNLRDCPHPKNGAKINAARQKFKREQQPKNVRYHIENDAFTHLKPGNISQNLRDAMNLRDEELPEYIYRMRRLGYPPGWMKEISQNDSDLVVFDFEGKTESKKRKAVEEFNSDLIIEYVGFNTPMGKYVRDDYKYYHCPSFSRNQGKHKMLEELNKNKKAAMDNLDDCDMELDTSFDDEQEKEIKCISPTLVALESEKQKLLDQLSVDNVSQSVKLDDTNNSQESIDDGFKTIDKIGEVDSEVDVSAVDISTVDLVNHIKMSSFGTPIIESASPYSKLPNTENFAKNVSQVLSFENLPESTGKFEQLSGILSKVRKTMKESNSKSS